MPRGKPQKTRFPRVYARDTNRGRVYDFYVVTADGQQAWSRSRPNLYEANRERGELQARADLGQVATAKPRTLERFALDDWLPHQVARVAQGNLQGSSLGQYRHDLDRHILPALGDRRLDRVNVETLEKFTDALTGAGLSNHTVRRVVTTLGGIFELARRRRLILVNPAGDLEKPAPVSRREPIILTVPELYALADLAPSGDERRLVLVKAFTGLRSAELLGLRWPNVDTSEGSETMLIVEQFSRGEQKARTKTKAGNRLHPLEPNTAALLREQAAEGRHSSAGYVFPAPEGGPWHSSNFNRRVWQRMRAAAGHPTLQLRDLRKFYVTLVRFHSGLPSSVTEQLTGHADDRIHRHYTRPVVGTDQLYRDALGPVFARPEATE